MTERMQIEAHWGYIPLVLKNGDFAEKGKLCCLDLSLSGQVCKGRKATGLIPLGVFGETLTGDGVKTVIVKLFNEYRLNWWTNDTVTAVAAADIGTLCYIKDDVTVTGDDTGASPAGLVLKVDAVKGVLVYSTLPAIPGS